MELIKVQAQELPTSPAPWKTNFWSESLFFVILKAAKMPATATDAVPEREKHDEMDILANALSTLQIYCQKPCRNHSLRFCH